MSLESASRSTAIGPDPVEQAGIQRPAAGSVRPSHPMRQRALVAIAIAVLGAYAAFALVDARRGTVRLKDARVDLAEVYGKLADIARLQKRPQVAALELEPPAAIAERVARAIGIAELPPASLLEVEPGEPVRIGRSEFKLRATMIRLAPAGLQQIVRFCDALQDDETGSLIRDLTLTEPRGESTERNQENWEAELVLTQMIYSPTSG